MRGASRRLLLGACCLLAAMLTIADAWAQAAPPRILGVGVAGCVKPGVRIVVRGSGFGRAGGRVLMLRDATVGVELPVAAWTDRSITATVPRQSKLAAGAWYQLGIQDKRSGKWISAQRRPLQICPKVAAADAAGGAAPKPEPRRPSVQPGRPQPAAPAAVQPPVPPATPLPGAPATEAAADDRVPDEVLAIATSLAEANTLAQQVGGLGYTVRALQDLPSLGFTLLRLGIPNGLDVPAALTALRQAFPGTLFDANALYGPDAATETAGEPRRYAKALIGWPDTGAGCAADVAIGLIDTAVDLDHPAFHDRRVLPRSFLPAGVPPAPPDHGTAVAALLIGAPDSNASGLLPADRLLAAAIFSIQDDDRIVGTTEAIARALDWLGQQDIRVVNLSLSGPGNLVMRLSVERAARRGMVLVAAAGNEGPYAAPVFPAGYQPVIAVTAVDAALQPYRGANHGDYIDLAAPGVDVWSARGRQGGRYNSGTSFATPFVTAAVALALSHHPDATPETLRQSLRRNARDLGAPGRDSTFGWGLLQPPDGC